MADSSGCNILNHLKSVSVSSLFNEVNEKRKKESWKLFFLMIDGKIEKIQKKNGFFIDL